MSTVTEDSKTAALFNSELDHSVCQLSNVRRVIDLQFSSEIHSLPPRGSSHWRKYSISPNLVNFPLNPRKEVDPICHQADCERQLNASL